MSFLSLLSCLSLYLLSSDQWYLDPYIRNCTFAQFCRENVSKITIFVGSTKIEKPRAIYEADVLIWHKNYDSKNYSNDIGLIRVKENITYDEYVQPITLGSKYDVAPGETAVVTGWGRLSVSDFINCN